MINFNRWLSVAVAALLSEVVPMTSLFQLRESLEQNSGKLATFGNITEHSVSGVLALTVAYFPVLQALVVLAAFAAYLAVTGTLTLRGFLYGLPTGFLVFSLGFTGVIALFVFSTLPLPQPIFYYLVLRLPMFLGLAVALWVAHHFQSSVQPFTPRA